MATESEATPTDQLVNGNSSGNGENGGSEPSPNDVVAVATNPLDAAPQAADTGTTTDENNDSKTNNNGDEDTTTTRQPSSSNKRPPNAFLAVLETANSLRKMDEKSIQDAAGNVGEVGDGSGSEGVVVAPSTDDGAAKGNNDGDYGNDGNNNNKAPPTLEDLADSDGEEPFFDTTATDDEDDSFVPDNNSNNGGNNNNNKPRGYTAQTVAAISSLMKGEESSLFLSLQQDQSLSSSGSGGGSGETESLLKKNPSAADASSSSSGSEGLKKKREITLQDRATAMLSVYKDYIQEEMEIDNGDDSVDEEQGTAPGDIINNEEQQVVQDQTYIGAQNFHQRLRREEIKLATLEKFCKDVQDSLEDEDDDSSTSTNEDDSSTNNIQDKYDISNGGRLTSGIKNEPPKPKKKLRVLPPTAATTTAAFRLKAEVALRATKNVAKRAVSKVTKDRNKAREEEKIKKADIATVDNDFDFQDYAQRAITEEEDTDQEYHDAYDDDDQAANNQSNQYDDTGDEERGDLWGLEGGHVKEADDEEGEYIMQHQQQQNGDDNGMVYGMHILERENSLKRKLPQDNEDIVKFNELCDELGVTPATHPGLHHGLRHFYHQMDNNESRTSRYRYPIFRTKKFKRSMVYLGVLLLIVLITASIMSAVSNGFEEVRQKKAPPLPDWKADEDWRLQQKLEWERDHKDNVGTASTDPLLAKKDEYQGASKLGYPGSSNGHNKPDLDKLFQKISAAYRPIWYDRETGWTGQTYDEALAWCGSHDGYVPCPYEVYCPDEVNLLAGVMENDGESWAPVINSNNEWVQVGTGKPCDLYSTKYGEVPIWGENGLNNEAITRHIMCCRKHPMEGSDTDTWEGHEEHSTVMKAKPPSQNDDASNGEAPAIKKESPQHKEEVDLEILFLSMKKQYNPISYDRDSGWNGQTYQESLDFCAQMDEYIPCPYEVYCPGGHGKLLDGVIKASGESWAPVIDDANDWVQVGAEDECTLYSETFKDLPKWGMTGENNEKITRTIMCCHSAPHIAKLIDEATSGIAGEDDVAAADSTTATVDEMGPYLVTLPEPEQLHSLSELEEKIRDTHHPRWYDIDSGWMGKSHNGAKAFCESIPRGGGGGTLHLCPLDAYCPNGPQETEPLYLQMDAFNEIQWAPISNQDNGWVMVGKFSDDFPLTCQTYLDINHREPEFGLDDSSPELKKHILCCEDDSGDDGSVLKESTEQDSDNDQSDVNMPNSEEHNAPPSDEVIDKAQSQISEQGSDAEEQKYLGGAPPAIGSDSDISSTEQTPTNPVATESSSMTESEKQIQDMHHPTWYSNQFGWQGTNYDAAKAFCQSIPHGSDGGTLHLCPLEAYCPNSSPPLYLQMDPFSGVQWAPFSNKYNGWVMVGDISDLTCQTYTQINHRDPSWGLDGSSTQLKQQILCCESKTDYDNIDDSAADIPQTQITSDGDVQGDKLTNNVVGIQQGGESSGPSMGETMPDLSQVGNQAFEHSITNNFNPTWFDIDVGGWDGGSHDNGIKFCEQFAGSHGKPMELCPYSAYCPEGPGKPVIGGHQANFDKEGEQWSPVFGSENHWVLIGKKGNNHSTTCLSHVQLNGDEPSWGLDDSNKKMKKHIMCCSPFQ